MAEEKNAPEPQAQEKKAPEKKEKRVRYFIVNPAGAVHQVSREHAQWRLKQAGWRMATDEEIARYEKTSVQEAGKPIAKPHSTELPETE